MDDFLFIAWIFIIVCWIAVGVAWLFRLGII